MLLPPASTAPSVSDKREHWPSYQTYYQNHSLHNMLHLNKNMPVRMPCCPPAPPQPGYPCMYLLSSHSPDSCYIFQCPADNLIFHYRCCPSLYFPCVSLYPNNINNIINEGQRYLSPHNHIIKPNPSFFNTLLRHF